MFRVLKEDKYSKLSLRIKMGMSLMSKNKNIGQAGR